MPDTLEMIARLVDAASQQRGLRTDCQAIADILADAATSLYALIFLENAVSDRQELIAGAGLTPTEFRRLDERIDRTALLRTLNDQQAVRLLVGDEPTLDFLDRPGVVSEIFCSPVISGSRSIGGVAVCFDKRTFRLTPEVQASIEIAASLVRGLVNASTLREEDDRKVEERDISARQEIRQRFRLSRLIGNSGAMRAVHDRVAQIARSNAPVLLRGESGTGKDLIAASIHHNSLRAKGPFVRVDCTLIPDSSLSSELFGTYSGSAARPGRMQEAEGGTLLLNEIAELSQETQVRLLRSMQHQQFEQVGGWETIRTNVRIIAASERPLEELVGDGILREDLYSRLSIYTIHLPPLRERKADILLLADHFLKKYSREHEKNILRLSTPAIDMLTAYHFPGNVRELENAIESAVLNSKEPVIHGHHLPPSLQTAAESGTEVRLTLESAVANFERGMIADALKSTRGNIAKAAVMLESTERILGYKVRKYNIDVRRFK